MGKVMRTNIVIDDKLMEEAFLLTGANTKKELVNLALEELVRLKKNQRRPTLSDAFCQLRRLNAGTEPLPSIDRKNRSNLFAESL